MVSVAEVADAYFQHYRLGNGDRQARLAVQADDWAWEFVDAAVRQRDPDLLSLLDALVEVLEADRAYLAYVGAGPVEDLLNEDPARWDVPLADRCRASPRWRHVLLAVDIDLKQQAALSALTSYLRPLRTDRR